jgi:GLPGLI family protein
VGTGKNLLAIVLLFLITIPAQAQVTSAVIEYERRTNIYKLYKDADQMQGMMEYIKNNKIQKENFMLYFNDSISVFKSKDGAPEGWAAWLTQRNTTIQNFELKERAQVLDLWGNEVYLRDTLKIREWKTTYDKRMIAGYECRKVIWQKNDSTKIYAWYTNELAVSCGPETFNGLPGTILGVATEDGGVVYFAKKVEIIEAKPVDELPKFKEKDVKTEEQISAEILSRFGKDMNGAAIVDRLFTW